MGAKENIQIVMAAFAAVEQRDRQKLNELYHPEVQFHWPPSFAAWNRIESWNALQPTEAERRMEPRVVAASDKEVVVQWIWKGVSASGARFETPVLGLYEVRDAKFARAQMFFFDTPGLEAFVRKSTAQAAGHGMS